MKAIQIMMDQELIADLDATDEVRQEGRSAVLRRAASEYLRRRRADGIRERYRSAYGSGCDLGAEYDGWEKQGTWPEE